MKELKKFESFIEMKFGAMSGKKDACREPSKSV